MLRVIWRQILHRAAAFHTFASMTSHDDAVKVSDTSGPTSLDEEHEQWQQGWHDAFSNIQSTCTEIQFTLSGILSEDGQATGGGVIGVSSGSGRYETRHIPHLLEDLRGFEEAGRSRRSPEQTSLRSMNLLDRAERELWALRGDLSRLSTEDRKQAAETECERLSGCISVAARFALDLLAVSYGMQISERVTDENARTYWDGRIECECRLLFGHRKRAVHRSERILTTHTSAFVSNLPAGVCGCRDRDGAGSFFTTHNPFSIQHVTDEDRGQADNRLRVDRKELQDSYEAYHLRRMRDKEREQNMFVRASW